MKKLRTHWNRGEVTLLIDRDSVLDSVSGSPAISANQVMYYSVYLVRQWQLLVGLAVRIGTRNLM